MPQSTVYNGLQLRRAGAFYPINQDTFALADCDGQGKLNKEFVIVERLWEITAIWGMTVK